MNNSLIPHVTEKSYAGIKEGKDEVSTYTFVVARALSKEIIKKQVEKEHNVPVTAVRIVNLPGKERRFKGIKGTTQATKKAIVRLKTGEQIKNFAPETAETEATKE